MGKVSSRHLPLFVIAASGGAILSMMAGYAIGGYATSGIDPSFGAYRGVAKAPVPSVAEAIDLPATPPLATLPSPGEQGFDDRLLASRN